MKSQNDLFHGDENTTDKPKKYMVKLSEVIHYEVEVEAFDEDEADSIAWEKVAEDYNGTYVSNQTGFQTDKVELIDDTPEPDYNYSLNYGGTD